MGSVLASSQAVGRVAVGSGSGPGGSTPAAREPAGIRSSSYWSPTGCCRRDRNGGFIERGSIAARLQTCWGCDARLADIHKLYECHDRLLEYKQVLFDHLVARWRNLFNVTFDVLLYDEHVLRGRSAI